MKNYDNKQKEMHYSDQLTEALNRKKKEKKRLGSEFMNQNQTILLLEQTVLLGLVELSVLSKSIPRTNPNFLI